MASLQVLRIFSLAGLALFGGILLTLMLAPAQVERAAKAFLVAEVKAEVEAALEAPVGANAKQIYGLFQDRLAERAASTRALLKARFAEYLAAVIAKLCQLDCEATSRLAGAIERGMKAHLAELETLGAKVKGFAQEKYDETLDKLRHELTVFSASNAAAFALLLGLTFLRPGLARPLALPAWLLLLSTVITCGFYIFGQNWFYAILLDNYVGYAYPAYIGVVFLFLLDICFNGATVTLFVLELIGSLIGALLRAISACLPG